MTVKNKPVAYVSYNNAANRLEVRVRAPASDTVTTHINITSLRLIMTLATNRRFLERLANGAALQRVLRTYAVLFSVWEHIPHGRLVWDDDHPAALPRLRLGWWCYGTPVRVLRDMPFHDEAHLVAFVGHPLRALRNVAEMRRQYDEWTHARARFHAIEAIQRARDDTIREFAENNGY